MVDIYEILRRNQDGTSDYVKEFLTNIGVEFNVDTYGNIYYLEHENAPLLSAHMDTVRKDADFCIGDFLTESESDKIVSGGILGGDDKCGVYIILRALEEKKTVNFIFSRDEEIGCLGIKALIKPKYVENKEIADKIRNNCTYCLVLDRRGNSDIICTQNSYGSKEFEEALKKISDDGGFGYKSEKGLCSDANTIRDYISTANLSVGYYNPHTQKEYIVKADLEKAYNYTISIIDGLTEKFAACEYHYTNYSKNNSYRDYSYYNYYGRYGYYDDDYEGYDYSGWSQRDWKNYNKDKKECKCDFCSYSSKIEKVYEFIMPNGAVKQICEFCLEDLEDEVKRVRARINNPTTTDTTK